MKSIILVDSKHILVNYLDKFNITKEKIVFLHWNDDDDISLMLKNRCCDEVERVVLDKNEFIK